MSIKKPILIIAGPTAVGKTDASILLAQELGAEIVSADSMQIYRGMDIGTAKPTKTQRKLIYHHMIDIAEPDQPYSVGDYLHDARTAIDGIISSVELLSLSADRLHTRAHTRTFPLASANWNCASAVSAESEGESGYSIRTW
jgi:tRNA dimethylallyltransferase